jgi:hypothetical protein
MGELEAPTQLGALGWADETAAFFEESPHKENGGSSYELPPFINRANKLDLLAQIVLGRPRDQAAERLLVRG